MREKMKKIIVAVVGVMIALTIVPLNFVSAKEAGSIEITETATNTPSKQLVAGVKLALYKIADADSDEDTGYRITDDFNKSGIQVKDILYTENLSEIAENLSDYAKDKSVEAQSEAMTNNDGYLKFSGLSDGIYLIRQINTKTDFERLGYTYTTEPYIVAIPSLDSNGNEVRSIICQPKGILKELEKKEMSLTVYKVWKDDNNKKGIRPDMIKVGLYKNGALEKEADLNAGNNWMYVWNNLDTDYSWSVKELKVPTGYSTSVSNNDQIWTITNTYKPTIPSIVKTGDNSNISFWIGLLVISAGIVSTAYMKCKKRKK